MCDEKLDLEALNREFESCRPEAILDWAVDRYWPSIVMSSSFQTQSVPLLHMVAGRKPEMPILFADTGYHFGETLAFKDRLQKMWRLNVVDVRSDCRDDPAPDGSGSPLHQRDPDRCCYLRKIKPMRKALEQARAWMTGIRREQTPERAQARIVERQYNGLLKINPLLNWTRQDLWQYIVAHNLPLHPLFSKGYSSVSCAPCARPVQPGEDERAGRWTETGKTECGLHTMMFQEPGEGNGGGG